MRVRVRVAHDGADLDVLPADLLDDVRVLVLGAHRDDLAAAEPDERSAKDEEQPLASSATPTAAPIATTLVSPRQPSRIVAAPVSVAAIMMVMIMIPNFVCNTIAA